jgi:hypothetical protein
MARRKAQTCGVRVRLPDAAGASRRANHGVLTTAAGLAFRKPGFPSRSASSWQGLLVVPGGAPLPPECSCCVHEPAGAAPRPAIKAPLERAPQRTR